MSLATHTERTVWTFYWSLAEYTPREARGDSAACKRLELLEGSDSQRSARALIPDIRQCVSHIDIMRMGHAMIRPSPGFMFSQERQRWLKSQGGIHFANSDLSGFSIFEEAQYRGVQAAESALRRISRG